MAAAQRSRVLRCCRCRLFQAHQVKKSLKWTCKACGEKQSLLRTYGEGSGADCRRHVQKLNLLQGQASEPPLRCLKAASEDAGEPQEENTGLPHCAGLLGMELQGSSFWSSAHCHTGELGGPRWKPGPASYGKAPSSKWARFLSSPGNSSHVDTEPTRPLLQGPRSAGLAQAEQGSPETETSRKVCSSWPLTTVQLPEATCSPERPIKKSPKGSWDIATPRLDAKPLAQETQTALSVSLCNLFTTGEDFDDDL
ncbi:MRN complex-interacting protein [Perognathus longimembris pacificus]|uniref:MRN complex-interacting protein n=1 Tax=Perognathus longimembris pacificus TaxID=214514 RepID=UPI002019C5DE|nr:MRN complex-interacting protein [Perognathus longimembris pacificus]